MEGQNEFVMNIHDDNDKGETSEAASLDLIEETEKEKEIEELLDEEVEPPQRPKVEKKGVLRCTAFQPTWGSGSGIEIVLKDKIKSRVLDSVDEEEKAKRKRKIKSRSPVGLLKVSNASLLQIMSLTLVVSALIATLGTPLLKEKIYFHFELWKWEIMVLVIIIARILSGWAVWVAGFFVRRNLILRKRYLFYLNGVKDSLRNCIWWGLVLIVWLWMLWASYFRLWQPFLFITKFMKCVLVTNVLWLFKTLILMVASSTIHVHTYFERVQCSLFNEYLIKTLSGAPATKTPKSRLHQFHNLKKHKVSASKMKRLINIVRRGTIAVDEEAEIKSADEAIIVATKIFQNVAKPSSMYIHLEDLVCFIREDEAAEMMRLFEGENNRISEFDLQNWVVNAFRERRSLALTLDDTKTTVNKLHHILKIMVACIITVVWLLVLDIGTWKYLLAISTQVLALVFIFGNACKTTFESVLFLFGRHPFDVGDYCEIDGVQLLVEEINITSTEFLRQSDGSKISYLNVYLASLPICNHSRSLAVQYQVQGVGAKENEGLRESQSESTSSDSQQCQDEGRSGESKKKR